tara:strand:+ start:32948 stop:33775 length:828 start_codon:yes stop_codon:yes gene_type:complete
MVMTDQLDNQAFDLIEGGEKIDLFHTVDATSTSVDIPGTFHTPETSATNSEIVHNTLLAAGMTPGYGVVADVADAILYGFEGEFANAALSIGSALPIVGQYVSAQRALYKAEKAGEKIYTFYRGVDSWKQGEMVKDGVFVGGGKQVGPHFFKGAASKEAKNLKVNELFYTGYGPELAAKYSKFGKGDGILLEFKVPESYLKKHGFDMHGQNMFSDAFHLSDHGEAVVFGKGLPKEYLTKVHKHGDVLEWKSYKMKLDVDNPKFEHWFDFDRKFGK